MKTGSSVVLFAFLLAGCGRSPATILCETDADCGEGLMCNSDGECQPTGEGSTCSPACKMNELCVEGKCLPVNGSCALGQICPTGEVCINGACVEQDCSNGKPCPDGTTCDGNVCVPDKQCGACPMGTACEKGQCVPIDC